MKVIGQLTLLGCIAPLQVNAPGELREALDAPDARWRGAVLVSDGAKGGAARFDGAGAHIDVGPCPMSSTQPFTLRCRMRTTKGGFSTVLMARAGDEVGLSLVMGRSPGAVSFEAWSWQHVKLISRVRVDDGVWHAVEVAYDPSAGIAVLLVDGKVQGTAELGDGASQAAMLRLGDNIGAQQPFAGDLDEVELVRTASHQELLNSLAPVLPLAQRESELRGLRERVLPRTTPSLEADRAESWPARRKAVRAGVIDAIGLAPAPAREPLDVRVHADAVRDGVRIQRVSWVGFPGQRSTGWLWTPARPRAGKRPAVLCPHGHWQHGAMHPAEQMRCATLAHFGWTVLSVDAVHVENVASGLNALGVMTWNNQRAIDVLLARDDVDPDRIACTGASGGGQQTYYLMAIEDRLTVAAPMVMACYFAEILDDQTAHCSCNHVPRVAAVADVPELCAIWAPRPVMFSSVSGDWTRRFPSEGLPELVAHWNRQGAQPPRSWFANEGHNFDRPMREALYGFLQDTLSGLAPDGLPRGHVAEPAFTPFAAQEFQALAQECPPAAPDEAQMTRDWLDRRTPVKGLAELAPGLDLEVVRREIVWRDGPESVWRRGTVTGSDGVPIPLRVREQKGVARKRWTAIVDPRGMSFSQDDATTDTDVVILDPRPYGEWAPFRSAWQRNGILLGRGEGYQAALDVATVVASLPGAASVTLETRGEAGVVGILAAHLCARITTVVTDPLGSTYAEDGNRWPLCPELLRWRDLPKLVATLPKPCKHQLRR